MEVHPTAAVVTATEAVVGTAALLQERTVEVAHHPTAEAHPTVVVVDTVEEEEDSKTPILVEDSTLSIFLNVN